MHWLYRIQERLHCTEKEAILLVTLLSMFSVGMVLRSAGMDELPYDDAWYAESDSLFGRYVREPIQPEGYGDWIVVGDTIEEKKPDFPIHVNTADADQLQFLPGIGPKMAERILVWRTDNGRFDSIGALREVSGIGPRTLEKLRPLVSVQDPDSLAEDGRSASNAVGDASGRSTPDADSSASGSEDDSTDSSTRSNPIPPGGSMPRD